MSDDQGNQPPSFAPRQPQRRPQGPGSSSRGGAPQAGGQHGGGQRANGQQGGEQQANGQQGGRQHRSGDLPASVQPRRAPSERPAAQPQRPQATPRRDARGSGDRPAATDRAAQPPSIPPRTGAGRSPVRGAATVVAGTRQRPGSGTTSRPGGSTRPPSSRPPGRLRPRWGRIIPIVLVLLVVVLSIWPISLFLWSNKQITHIDALSGAPGTPGTTYLIAGSDSRADGAIIDPETLGARTDTIMLLHVPKKGPSALISLPRDTYVEIVGHGPAKLNAAFAYGNAPLLVSTVEALTGLTIDAYVEVGMGGVRGIVEALGGVTLCSDLTVNDPESGMIWTPGCHPSDGVQALAFVRMRKADPLGDIGRGQRQRQLISAVTAKAKDVSLLWHPSKQRTLIKAATSSLTVSNGMDIVDLAQMAIAFQNATGPGGITGTPPIKSMDYRPGNVGSTVLLDPDTTPAFFRAIEAGTLPPGPVNGTPEG